MTADRVERLRQLCLSLPEVTERLTHGEPGFFVRDKKLFLNMDSHHHGTEHLGFWCAAPPGAQEALVAQDAARFFRPPYVGGRGWVGVRLEAAGLGEPDWAELGEIVRDAYRQVAPKALIAELGD